MVTCYSFVKREEGRSWQGGRWVILLVKGKKTDLVRWYVIQLVKEKKKDLVRVLGRSFCR